jgi:hypothetical protein
MIPTMRRILLPALASLLLVGCASEPPRDPAVALGPRGMLGYHLRAGAASEVPGGEIGFVVTANGGGGYRIAWVAFDGSASVFSGSVVTDGVFDPASTLPLSGRETITARGAAELDFSSVPGSLPDGVDFVPSVDPIYVDLRIDGAAAPIFFTGADTSRLLRSGYDPVAFTSP